MRICPTTNLDALAQILTVLKQNVFYEIKTNKSCAEKTCIPHERVGLGDSRTAKIQILAAHPSELLCF